MAVVVATAMVENLESLQRRSSLEILQRQEDGTGGDGAGGECGKFCRARTLLLHAPGKNPTPPLRGGSATLPVLKTLKRALEPEIGRGRGPEDPAKRKAEEPRMPDSPPRHGLAGEGAKCGARAQGGR